MPPAASVPPWSVIASAAVLLPYAVAPLRIARSVVPVSTTHLPLNPEKHAAAATPFR